MYEILNFLKGGLIDNYWYALLYLIIGTHITIMGVTLYLHREATNKAIKLSPIISHFYRLWLWLTTGMVTKEWVENS